MKPKRPRLPSHRVFILPTGVGMVYGLGALGFLYAAGASGNNLVYILFF